MRTCIICSAFLSDALDMHFQRHFNFNSGWLQHQFDCGASSATKPGKMDFLGQAQGGCLEDPSSGRDLACMLALCVHSGGQVNSSCNYLWVCFVAVVYSCVVLACVGPPAKRERWKLRNGTDTSRKPFIVVSSRQARSGSLLNESFESMERAEAIGL